MTKQTHRQQEQVFGPTTNLVFIEYDHDDVHDTAAIQAIGPTTNLVVVPIPEYDHDGVLLLLHEYIRTPLMV